MTDSAIELLQRLKQQGIKVSVLEDTLKVEAPKDMNISQDLLQQIKGLKQEIIQLVKVSSMSDNNMEIIPDTEHRLEPFPLNDVQQAYWIGRTGNFDFGNVATHIYSEFENDGIDLERFELAWNKLIQRHDMLRAVIRPDGLQQILPEVPHYKPAINDLQALNAEETERKLHEVREALSHQILNPHSWPLFDIQVSIIDAKRVRIHMSIDLLIADGRSCEIILGELSHFYENSTDELAELSLSFRDCIYEELNRKTLPKYQQSLQYWKERLVTLPPAPELPLVNVAISIDKPKFKRFKGRLSPDLWQRIKKTARDVGISPSSVLLTAYSIVLAKWSRNADFTLNLTLFNRQNIHPEINNIIGDFTRLTLLAIKSAGQGRFLEQAKRIQNQLWQDIDHRAVSGVEVMRELTRLHGGNQNKNMPIVFTSTLDNSDLSLFNEASLQQNGMIEDVVEVVGIGKEVYGISQTPQVWIDHQVAERGAALVFNWDTIEGLFLPGVIEAMFNAYCALLEKLARVESWNAVGVESIPLTTDEQTLRTQTNATQKTFARSTLHGLIATQVQNKPNVIACVSADKTLTYADLDGLSNQLAGYLNVKGVKKNAFVAIVMDKGWEQWVAVLGVLKAGAAYLPISPDWPIERIEFLLAESGASIVLTRPGIIADWQGKGKILELTEAVLAPYSTSFSAEYDPDALAYLIYTSGSMGKPKGVMIRHQAAVNTIQDINEKFNVNHNDVFFALSALSFDLSVYDIFGALAVGAKTVIPKQDQCNDPAAWLPLIKQHKVTLWNSVPALMDMLITYLQADLTKRDVASLRLALLSGDWIPIDLPKKVSQCHSSLQMVSLGGATEASIWSVYYPIDVVQSDWHSIPYGKPLANQTLHILGNDLQPKPTWVVGDIYIGGAGLAEGYYRDENKTAKAFIENPYTGERLYKTGDKGRYMADGNIEFLGREDQQVKIRGYRVELGEVESAIGQFSGIQSVIVCAQGERFDRKQLIAFYIANEIINDTDLKSFLLKKVPEYAVPAHFVQLECFPLTANGKIDRAFLLQNNHIQQIVSKEYLEPRGSIEEALANIWLNLLKVKKISRNDNFFELGGDSILANQVIIDSVAFFHKNLTMKDVFEHPVFSEFADLIDASDIVLEREQVIEADLPPVFRDDNQLYQPYPLTGLQQAYFIGRSDAFALGNVACHQYQEVDIVNLDYNRLGFCWDKILQRHDILRTIFLPDGTQQLLKEPPAYQIEYQDFSQLESKLREERLLEIREQLSHQVMDIYQWPLFDIRVTKIDDHKWRMHLSIDAMIADAWSVGLISEEMAKLYHNPNIVLPMIGLTFREYVLTEESLKKTDVYKRALQYWENRYHSIPPAPNFSFEKNIAEICKPTFCRRESSLEPTLWETLRLRATRQGMTPAGLILAVFAEVLTTWSKSSHFTINVPQFNRFNFHPDVNQLIGEFASFYLVEINNGIEKSFMNRARRIQKQLWDDISHRHVNGMHVIRELARTQGDGVPVEMPVVFTSIIGLIDGTGGEMTNGEDTALKQFGELVYGISQTPQVWLDCQVGEQNGKLIYNWDSIDELFADGMLDDMFAAFDLLIHELAQNDALWQGQAFDLVPEKDRQCVRLANETSVDFGTYQLTDIILEQAIKTPNNQAIITSNKVLTYRELVNQGQHIANWLHQQGVKQGELVAVVMEKSADQMIASLAILLAGAVFVPIDAELPMERLHNVLEDTCVRYIITTEFAISQLSGLSGRNVVMLTQILSDSVSSEVMFIPPARNPQDLAYVIYTSGSTGKPKGCMLSHGNISNLVAHTNRELKVSENDRAFAVTPFHHDLAIYDFLGMLTVGGAIVIPDHLLRKDPQHWITLIHEHAVTLWNSVPPLMEMLVLFLENEQLGLPASFRQVILGGDWIPVTLPDRIKALSHRANGCQILAIGGPTETTIWNIWYHIKDKVSDRKSIPYGKPTSNNRYFIFNDHMQQRPIGVIGEMYCGGAQVGLGYWRNPQATNEKFLLHPETKERLYRTGDLGRFLPDGNIEFIGRIDSQVKIKGVRIELGEIEHVLSTHDEIDNVVVVALENSNEGKQLVAIIEQKRPEAEASKPQLAESKEEKVASPPDNHTAKNPMMEIPDLPKGILVDPLERLEFKSKKVAIRRDLEQYDSINLINLKHDEVFIKDFIDRRSHRIFNKEKISLKAFSQFLSVLQSVEFEKLGFAKYQYPSGGGLYPVQVYFYINPETIENIPGGGYYYHPEDHKLIHLCDFDENDGPQSKNDQPFIKESGFSIVLIGDTQAIFPMYGEKLSNHLLSLEAGIIAQTLEYKTINSNIGLCQLGTINKDFLQKAFKLEERHCFLHCLIGGSINPTGSGNVQAMLDDSGAYKLIEDKQTALTPQGLKAFLKGKLAEVMIPDKFIILDAFPLTANGKIDRKTIINQIGSEITFNRKIIEYVEPRTKMETKVAEIWKEILEIDKVGVYDNFMDLGGNSIHVVRLHNRLKQEFKTEMAIYELFQFSDVASLSENLQAGNVDLTGNLDESLERAAIRQAQRNRRNRENKETDFVR